MSSSEGKEGGLTLDLDPETSNVQSKGRIVGGHGPDKPADDRVKALVEKVRPQVEAKHGPLQEYTVESYTTQVVAGINYKIKLRIAPGKVIEIKVHQPLPHTGTEPSLMD